MICGTAIVPWWHVGLYTFSLNVAVLFTFFYFINVYWSAAIFELLCQEISFGNAHAQYVLENNIAICKQCTCPKRQ